MSGHLSFHLSFILSFPCYHVSSTSFHICCTSFVLIISSGMYISYALRIFSYALFQSVLHGSSCFLCIGLVFYYQQCVYLYISKGLQMCFIFICTGTYKRCPNCIELGCVAVRHQYYPEALTLAFLIWLAHNKRDCLLPPSSLIAHFSLEACARMLVMINPIST